MTFGQRRVKTDLFTKHSTANKATIALTKNANLCIMALFRERSAYLTLVFLDQFKGKSRQITNYSYFGLMTSLPSILIDILPSNYCLNSLSNYKGSLLPLSDFAQLMICRYQLQVLAFRMFYCLRSEQASLLQTKNPFQGLKFICLDLSMHCAQNTVLASSQKHYAVETAYMQSFQLLYVAQNIANEMAILARKYKKYFIQIKYQTFYLNYLPINPKLPAFMDKEWRKQLFMENKMVVQEIVINKKVVCIIHYSLDSGAFFLFFSVSNSRIRIPPSIMSRPGVIGLAEFQDSYLMFVTESTYFLYQLRMRTYLPFYPIRFQRKRNGLTYFGMPFEIQCQYVIILSHLNEAYQLYFNTIIIVQLYQLICYYNEDKVILYLKLIGMFIVRTKSLLKQLKQIPIPLSLQSITNISRFGFSASKWDKKQFLPKLQKQIIDSQGKIIYVDNESEAYFKNNNWKIDYNQSKTLFKFIKEEPNHSIRVLTHVKSDPPNDPAIQKKVPQQSQNQNEKLNYSQIAIYIRKKGAQKWFTAQMAVFQGSIELLGVFFTASQQPDFSWQKATYPGPQLKTLPMQVLDGINQMFKQFGLTSQVIMNMVIHSSSKVDQIDLEWLKRLKQIWA